MGERLTRVWQQLETGLTGGAGKVSSPQSVSSAVIHLKPLQTVVLGVRLKGCVHVCVCVWEAACGHAQVPVKVRRLCLLVHKGVGVSASCMMDLCLQQCALVKGWVWRREGICVSVNGVCTCKGIIVDNCTFTRGE